MKCTAPPSVAISFDQPYMKRELQLVNFHNLEKESNLGDNSYVKKVMPLLAF